eukprot:8638656-Pyramimonas_sp.AAC.1
MRASCWISAQCPSGEGGPGQEAKPVENGTSDILERGAKQRKSRQDEDTAAPCSGTDGSSPRHPPA